MPQQARVRKQTVVDYSSGNKVQKSLSRGMVYRELLLELSLAPTLLAANNTTAKTLRGDEWAVVKKIEIIANGTDVIKSISGKALRWLNMIWNHAMPGLSAALGDGATANPACKSILVLPFWQSDSIRPIDTALDSSVLSDLQIAVTWGTFTDINADASAWTTQPTLTVFSKESFGFDQAPVFSNYRFFEISQNIAATNGDLQVALPVGPVYRAFTLLMDDAGVEKTGLLNNLKLSSGTTIFADIDAFTLNDNFTARMGMSRWVNGAEEMKQVSAKSSIQGVYHYDHVQDGYLSEGIDTVGLSEFLLRLDVTVGGGTTTALIVPHQIIPVR